MFNKMKIDVLGRHTMVPFASCGIMPPVFGAHMKFVKTTVEIIGRRFDDVATFSFIPTFLNSFQGLRSGGVGATTYANTGRYLSVPGVGSIPLV